MTSPIYTTVTNKTSSSITAQWFTDTDYLIIKPGASIKMDGDIWTFNNNRADLKASLLGAYEKGIIDIVLSVRDKDGTFHEINYALTSREVKPATQTTSVAVDNVNAASKSDVIDSFISGGKESIIAGSDESSKLARSFGIGVSVATAEDNEPSVTVMKGNEIPTDDTVAVASNSVLAGKTASVDASEKMSVDIADEFNALTAEKKWQEAYDLLVATFGADKITFTPKTIMTLKTFSSVNKKYKLIEE